MKARTAAWYGGFGLLPLWLALAWCLLASRHRPDFWLVAPWLLFLLVPLCAVTLAMARVTHSVYVGTRGGTAPKLKRSAFCLAGLSAVLLAGFAIHWMKQARVKADQEAGRLLVERSPDVARIAPGGAQVFLRVTQYDASGVANQFHYSVSTDDPGTSFMAIVDASRARGDQGLRLVCVLPSDRYDQRESGRGPCPAAESVR